MRQQYAWRSAVIRFFGFVAAMVMLQMVRIQASAEAEQFRKQKDIFAGEYKIYYPERGEIYDRNGHLLAGNQTVYEVGVDLNTVQDPHSIAMAISVNLGKNYDKVYSDILNPPPGIYYLVLDNFASPEAVDNLKELKTELNKSETPTPSLAGLEFSQRLERSYPENALASNVLGFVNLEGRGYFGIEEKYNDLLAGNPVKVWVPSDPNRAVEIPQIPNGTSLILTINRDLQDAVEEILDHSLYEYGAQHGTIIVMDPKNGDILAMAATPRMDLNNFQNYGVIYNNASEYNRAIGMPYEPGSVVKIFTMAAALDTRSGQSQHYFPGHRRIPGWWRNHQKLGSRSLGPANDGRLLAALTQRLHGLAGHPTWPAKLLWVHAPLRLWQPDRSGYGRGSGRQAQGSGRCGLVSR